MRIRKRDGSLQVYEERKIARAMLMAFNEVSPGETINPQPLLHFITQAVMLKAKDDIIEIETVQDLVEEALMHHGHEPIAKAYIIYRHERAKMRAIRKKPDPHAPADYIHVAKYAKYLPEQKRRETYIETVDRVEDMHHKYYRDLGIRIPDLTSLIHDAFDQVRIKRCLPSMRSMQFAGPAIFHHHARMYNCSFTLADRPRVFQEIMYLLLCGCGVGYSVQWQHVEKLPVLKRIDKKQVAHYEIKDTIEGWADAIGALFTSFIHGYHIEFSYHLIRPEGSPLKTSGGIAPGHLSLRTAIENIRDLLLRAQGRKLRPIEVHDIICFEAEAVLAGGIRRSSLLSLFSPHDTEMLYAKAMGNFLPSYGDNKGLNSQRQMANNSAAFLRSKTNQDDFDRVIRVAEENYGDPGFYFTNNLNYGPNPCGEIGMNPVWGNGNDSTNDDPTGFGFCNLTEVNVAACKTKEEFFEAVKAATAICTLQAGYTDFRYLGKESRLIAERDALLGVSITGMMDNPSIAFDAKILQDAAKFVLEVNSYVAKMIGINECARGTTIKPSGTASWELGGVGPGCHPRHARRFFRRFTANPNEPFVQYFRSINPHMVEVKPNGDLSVIFPVECDDKAITVKDLPAEEFLDKVFTVYENWIVPATRLATRGKDADLTHNVSCTVTMKPEERAVVMQKVWMNRYRIAALSFAPYMLDKRFPFAPNEEVSTPEDEIRWNYYLANYQRVDWTDMVEEKDEVNRSTDPACAGGACEV